MGRRANSEGSIYRRTDGRWCGTVSLDGGRRKSYYGKTRQEVGQKLAEALKARQDGLPLPAERQTVGRYLLEWLESAKPSVRYTTWKRYEELTRLHAVPYIGSIRLSRFTPQHVEGLYANRGEAGVGPGTVRQLHAVLRRALAQATRWGLTPRNVVSLVKPPRSPRREMRTLSPDQVKTLLASARGDRLEALYVLAISTGMRQGELLALRWQDLDFDSAAVQVRGSLQRTRSALEIVEPKTRSSRRAVALTSTALAALQRHRVAQAEERLRMGPAWEDNNLVFPNQLGRPLDAANLLHYSYYPLLTAAGLPRFRFHELRHTAATLMLSGGVHPKVASDMLGHSQIAVTLDLYSHVSPALQREAATVLDEVLRA